MPVQPPGPESRIYRPVELNNEVRLHLEAGFPRLWIQGEISNLARPASGHLYFTLKDARAQLRCALFRGNARGLGFKPENGQEVLVRGRLSLYEPRGDYQLIADGLLEGGAGALQAAFEKLKARLQAEGLFDAEAKKPLPQWPRGISLVTSASGAAIRDLLKVLGERWPAARVRIYPSQVQGERAAEELTAALEAADRHGFGEVIILARGGGSLEDLWSFNDERLARAIFAARTPIVSAVGHESDFTIADFVADWRAPTPSAAAAAVTPDGPALARSVEQFDRRLRRASERVLNDRAQAIDELVRRLASQRPGRRLAELDQRLTGLAQRARPAIGRAISQPERQLEGLATRLVARHPKRQLDRLEPELERAEARLARAIDTRLKQLSQRLGAAGRALGGVSPLAVLDRGYALVRDPEGQAMTERDQFKKGIKINILMHGFEVDAQIESSPRKARLK